MDIEETTKYITDSIFYITYKSPKELPKVPLKDLVPYDNGRSSEERILSTVCILPSYHY